MRSLLPWILTTAALFLISTPAAAHIEVTSHITRHGRDQQKNGPCGAANSDGPGANVYVYEPGETLTIGWHEFINHPGHYRLSFDDQGSDDFVDPATAVERYSNDTVLLDGIEDLDGVSEYEASITLPDSECDACTIQLIQLMTDKSPYGDGNDIYYHCIDVRLVEGGGPHQLDDDEGCGCTTSGGSGGLGGSSLAMFLGLGILCARRRRHSATRVQTHH